MEAVLCWQRTMPDVWTLLTLFSATLTVADGYMADSWQVLYYLCKDDSTFDARPSHDPLRSELTAFLSRASGARAPWTVDHDTNLTLVTDCHAGRRITRMIVVYDVMRKV